MIRYYTYYNCGGYKDMYIGADNMNVDATYFIPLLSVWKNRNMAGDEEKISRAEAVTQVKLMTNAVSCSFPSECNVLFTHGGYKAIYQTLKDGRTCFCIRDIEELVRDEEDRKNPFNFLFVAEGEDSIKRLDSLAVLYLDDSNKMENSIRDSISYDPVINGIKFNLNKLNQLFDNNNCAIHHVAARISYLKAFNIQSAITELGINAKDVDAFYDENNNIIKGKLLSYSSEKDNPLVLEPLGNNSRPNGKSEDVSVETQDASAINNVSYFNQVEDIDVENAKVKDILQKVSSTSKDIDDVKRQINALSNVISEDFSNMKTLINEIKGNCENTSNNLETLSDYFFANPSFKQTAKYLIVLLIGFILGLILF